MSGEADTTGDHASDRRATRKQLFKFGAFAIVGFAIEASVLALLTHGAGMNPYLARFPAWFTKILVTWPLNRKWTFRGERSAHLGREFAKYAGSQATGASSNFAVYMAVLALWKNIPTPVLALFIGALLGFAINFTLSKVWVFRKGKKAEDHKGASA